MKRKVPEINSSSTADIAFLLLSFFLITTSMGDDKGLPRRLPALPSEDRPAEDAKLKERNVLRLALDAQDRLTCNGQALDIAGLRAQAKDFIANPDNASDKPEKFPADIPLLGKMEITGKHVIVLECDRNASYKAYMAVQDELAGAYAELRNELALQRWHKAYTSLRPEQQEAIRKVYPQRIGG